MVPDPSKTSLGLEYFCNEGDELWNSRDEELIDLGKREIEKIGLARYEDVIDGSVYRVEKSYPVYDSNYRDHLAKVRDFIDSLENFQTIGRNGLHRYNNQDHAMLTGMLAVRNSLNGEKNDHWKRNKEKKYIWTFKVVRSGETGDLGYDNDSLFIQENHGRDQNDGDNTLEKTVTPAIAE